MKDDHLQFLNKIKIARAEQSLSQQDLASLVGASRQTIIAIEKGQFNPSARLAMLLCLALNKSFEELFYFETNKKR